MLKPELTIYDYTRILKKRKWIILITALLVISFTAIFTMLQRNVYRTKAVVMAGNKNVFSEMFGDYYNSINLHTEAKLIVSMPVLTKVVDNIFGSDKRLLESEKNIYINKIRKMIRTKVDVQTKTIEIIVSGSNPKLISRIANEVSIAYSSYATKKRKENIKENFNFLNNQLVHYQKELDGNEKKIEDFREKEKIVDIDMELGSKLSLSASIANKLANVIAEKRTLVEQLEQLRKNSGSKSYMGLDNVKSGPVARLNEKLIELEIERLKLTEIYKPTHPKIKNIDLSISVIKRQISKQLSKFYNREELSLIIKVRIQDAKLKALRETEKELNRLISKMPRKKAILARMKKKSKFIENMVKIFSKKIEEAKIYSSDKDSEKPTIIQKSIVPKRAIKPDPVFNMLIGMISGIITGIFFAFFVESIDVSVSTVEEVENFVNLPVLGIIPYTKHDEIKTKGGTSSTISKKCVLYHDPRSTCSEAFRILRTNMHFIALGNKKMFMVASSLPGEGKTFASINLAATFAQLGAKVLLCDFNLRDPEVHSYFGISKNPGITDILIGDMSWKEAVKETKITNLEVLCSGPIPPNPSELIISRQCTDLLEEVKAAYDVVILDSSPLIPVTDGAILSNKVDMTILVHNAIKTSMMILLRAKGQLNGVNSVIGGVILNQLKSTIFMDPDVPVNYYYAKKKDVA